MSQQLLCDTYVSNKNLVPMSTQIWISLHDKVKNSLLEVALCMFFRIGVLKNFAIFTGNHLS